MRIVMVAARYFPFVGGVETHIHEAGTRMADLGHQVTVLTTDPTGALPVRETVCGMRVNRVRAWPRKQDYYIAPRIYTELSKPEYDIVHIQGYNTFTAPLGMLGAIRRKIPFVLTFHSGGHSSKLRNSIRGVHHALLSPLIGRASRLIGVSEYEAAFFSTRMKLAREQFTVVPNGASLPPSTLGLQVNPFLVVSIGRLEQYKGHHRAIAAFPALLRRIPAARLMIIGSGPYEPELRRMIRSLGLEERITIGAIPSSERQRLSDLLSAAGLVVLLSEYEAHPVSVMEALSLRRPVLVSDTSGLRELAEKGLCRSIPLNATSDTTAGVIAEDLMATRAIPTVSLPDWDDCTAQLVRIYERVLNGPSTTTRFSSSACLERPRSQTAGAADGD